jgi:ABC-type Fe3+-hydroxamate transport system substrate-binding protein
VRKKCFFIFLLIAFSVLLIEGCGCQNQNDATATPSVEIQAETGSPITTPVPTIPVVASEGLSTAEIDELKSKSVSFYESAFTGDYTQCEALMTDDFRNSFESLKEANNGQIDQYGSALVLSLNQYTNVSTPSQIGEPIAYGGDPDYIVTLLLQENYTARISLMKNTDGSFSVSTFALQTLSTGEGGTMGNGGF